MKEISQKMVKNNFQLSTPLLFLIFNQPEITVRTFNEIRKARELLCAKARPDEIGGIFTWLYNNLDLFGDGDEQKDSALLIIKQGMVDHGLIMDPEVNLAACLIKLARLKDQNKTA